MVWYAEAELLCRWMQIKDGDETQAKEETPTTVRKRPLKEACHSEGTSVEAEQRMEDRETKRIKVQEVMESVESLLSREVDTWGDVADYDVFC